jgi:hypothetical protein
MSSKASLYLTLFQGVAALALSVAFANGAAA